MVKLLLPGSRLKRHCPFPLRVLIAGLLASTLSPLGAQQWEAVPLVTQAQRNSGNTGGEGCQVCLALAIDSTGNFLLMGTDVGGIYRSLNGGTNWEPCNVGYKPRGGAGAAIDPHNSNRCLMAGADSGSRAWHGLYLSTNQGASWQSVLALNYQGHRDYRDQIAYDPGSLAGGMSTVVYYSGLSGGLYKSVNGGLNWSLLHASFTNYTVKVHPTLGYVYLAGSRGFYRSTNGGGTFTQMTNGLGSGSVLGLDVIATAPDHVYVNKADGVYVSTNAGLTFVKRPGTGLDTGKTPGLCRLKVSPVNPNHMVINVDTGVWYNQPHYWSTNGGTNWQSVSFDHSQSFMPYNGRPHVYVWHPTQAQVCYSFGGDWLTKSTDAGKTFRWNNQGYNGVALSGIFNFNTTNADLLLVTSQDYNSALTTDGGYTWKYLNVSGAGWGGFNYGGYAFSASRLVAGNATGWGDPRTLRISTNGGSTWIALTNTGNFTDTACGDPKNPAIGFWHNWRTTDAGATWTQLNGCDGVFTYNPTGSRELYGVAGGKTVVKSLDSGVTWTAVTTLSSGTIKDLAYDQARNRLYIVDGPGRKLYRWEGGVLTDITSTLPADNHGAKGANTVAVDPVNPDVVYVGKHADVYCSSVSVVRSVNAGTNWTVLTKQAAGPGLDGGREANCIRVHPVTRYAYVAGGCYGLWKIAPPGGGLPVISVTASAPTAAEPNVPGEFSFTRAGSTNAAVTVNFVVGGTATSGVDYQTLGTNITIAVGQTSATLAVTVIDDLLSEGPETVVVTLASGTGYLVGAPASATVTIADDDLTAQNGLNASYYNNTNLSGAPVLTRVDPNINFSWGTGSPGAGVNADNFSCKWTGYVQPQFSQTYTFYLNHNDGGRLWVNGVKLVENWNVGIAEDSGTIELVAGNYYPIEVHHFEGVNTATAILSWSSANQPKQVIPTERLFPTLPAMPPVVTVVASEPHAAEPDTPGAFMFVRSGSTNLALTVNFTVAGTATSNVDFQPLGTSVIIPAGQSHAVLPVVVLDDQLVEGNETVLISLASGAGYVIGSPSNAVVTIADDDRPTVTIVASQPTAAEPDTAGAFTFLREGTTNGNLTVHFSVTGTATSGVDYQGLGTSLVIPDGQSETILPVVVLDDHRVEGTETVPVTLAAGVGYVTGLPDTATVYITDNEPLPRLDIGPEGQGVTLLWPTNGTEELVLQQTRDLALGEWTPATNSPVILGTNYSVTLPVDLPCQYFRLSR